MSFFLLVMSLCDSFAKSHSPISIGIEKNAQIRFYVIVGAAYSHMVQIWDGEDQIFDPNNPGQNFVGNGEGKIIGDSIFRLKSGTLKLIMKYWDEKKMEHDTHGIEVTSFKIVDKQECPDKNPEWWTLWPQNITFIQIEGHDGRDHDNPDIIIKLWINSPKIQARPYVHTQANFVSRNKYESTTTVTLGPGSGEAPEVRVDLLVVRHCFTKIDRVNQTPYFNCNKKDFSNVVSGYLKHPTNNKDMGVFYIYSTVTHNGVTYPEEVCRYSENACPYD